VSNVYLTELISVFTQHGCHLLIPRVSCRSCYCSCVLVSSNRVSYLELWEKAWELKHGTNFRHAGQLHLGHDLQLLGTDRDMNMTVFSSCLSSCYLCMLRKNFLNGLKYFIIIIIISTPGVTLAHSIHFYLTCLPFLKKPNTLKI
jgi:hypothetical protein